jgi:protoporphyrinogen oxidase
MTIGILGGGLVGLVIGGTVGQPNEILEADDRPGGHCRSLVANGYTFDLGGPHIIFSRNKEILARMVAMLGENAGEQYRNNKILYKGSYIKYPFENGIFDLGPQERFECLRDFLVNNNDKEGGNFLLPYNEKIWNCPAEEMSDDWAVGRVPIPTPEEMMKSAVGVTTEGAVHQANFTYPRVGGIEALPRAFEVDCPSIITNFKVSRVWREAGQWCVSDGRSVRRYERLVSTIPIQDLIAALPDVPGEIITRAGALKFNSLSVVMLGFRSEAPNPCTAIYVPERKYPFHRLSMPRNFSDHAVPPGHEAIAAEITTNPGDGFHELDDQALIEAVLDGVEDLGLAKREDLRFSGVHRTRFAYVIPTFDYQENLAVALEYIGSLGIVSCGRNAEFAYINMDEAIRRGLAVSETLTRHAPSSDAA